MILIVPVITNFPLRVNISFKLGGNSVVCVCMCVLIRARWGVEIESSNVIFSFFHI